MDVWKNDYRNQFQIVFSLLKGQHHAEYRAGMERQWRLQASEVSREAALRELSVQSNISKNASQMRKKAIYGGLGGCPDVVRRRGRQCLYDWCDHQMKGFCDPFSQ